MVLRISQAVTAATPLVDRVTEALRRSFGLQHCDEPPELLQPVPIDRIVDPAAFPPVLDQPCALQCLEMEGKKWLSNSQSRSEFTNALLSVSQQLEYSNPCLIGERLELPTALPDT